MDWRTFFGLPAKPTVRITDVRMHGADVVLITGTVDGVATKQYVNTSDLTGSRANQCRQAAAALRATVHRPGTPYDFLLGTQEGA
jgi:hypothetical protein